MRRTWIVIPLMLTALAAQAGELVVGRYSRIVSDAPEAPLSAPVLNAFVSARTVGDAVRIVLSPTGYALANGRYTDPMQPTLLALQLPYVQRDLRASTAIEALVRLAGPGYRVMVDHVHRQIGFEVRPHFANYSHTATTPSKPRALARTSAWNCRALAGKFQCEAAS